MRTKKMVAINGTSMAACLRSLRGLREIVLREAHPPPPPDFVSLKVFGDELGQRLAAAKVQGDFINPWSVAGLGRNELRHAAVLAWLLDQDETHGFGNKILFELLKAATFKGKARVISAFTSPNEYRVRTECYPLSNERNRVDIEIESPSGLILIEIKIDAIEGRDQIKRYLELLDAKAPGRPRILIYLSLKDEVSLSESSERIAITTWTRLGDALRSLMPLVEDSLSFPERLLLQFADHVSSL